MVSKIKIGRGRGKREEGRGSNISNTLLFMSMYFDLKKIYR